MVDDLVDDVKLTFVFSFQEVAGTRGGCNSVGSHAEYETHRKQMNHCQNYFQIQY